MALLKKIEGNVAFLKEAQKQRKKSKRPKPKPKPTSPRRSFSRGPHQPPRTDPAPACHASAKERVSRLSHQARSPTPAAKPSPSHGAPTSVPWCHVASQPSIHSQSSATCWSQTAPLAPLARPTRPTRLHSAGVAPHAPGSWRRGPIDVSFQCRFSHFLHDFSTFGSDFAL